VADHVKVRTFGLIPTVAKPFTMARKRYPQVFPIFLVIMTICPKQARGARSSTPSTRKPLVSPLSGNHFPSFFAARRASPSAVRQARLRRDQITTKTIGKQSSHQLGRRGRP